MRWPMTSYLVECTVSLHINYGFTSHRSSSKPSTILFFVFLNLCVNTNNWGRFRQNLSNFRLWLLYNHWPIFLCNLKNKHRRCIQLYIFGIFTTRQTFWHYVQGNRSMLQFLIHVELSRSMAATLKMPQYAADQKNVANNLIILSAKSHSFNISCTINVLSCLTMTSKLW